MLHLSLYKYTDKPIIVDKTSYLGTPLNVTGDAMYSNQDMENPVVTMSFSTEPDYNYAYIQEYHRWYFLTNKTWVGANVWSFTFHVDELYTYRALVGSISGLVAYSMSGSQYKQDPRLVYNEPLTRYTFSPKTPVHPSSPTYPGTPWVLLRYYQMDINTSLLPGSPWSIKCAYMTFRAYNAFMSNYIGWLQGITSDYEKKAVAVGSCIIDVSVVWYIDPETTDRNAFDTLTSDLDIVFNTPAVLKANNNVPVTIRAGWTGTGGELNCEVYQVNPYTAHLSGRNFSFDFASANHWNRFADFVIYLPYIGKIGLQPAKLGLDDDVLYTLTVRVVHESAENAYVVTIYLNGTAIRETRNAFNVPTTVAFPIDTSFENQQGAVRNAIWNFAGNSISMIASGIMTKGASLGNSVGNLIGNVSSTALSLENLQMRDAMSQQFMGTVGGSPDLTDPANDTIYAAVTELQPAPDYDVYQADHGYPDGACRTLGNLTGYVQMQDFEMIYDANATKGEMDRLEAQLYQGVIM